MPHPATLTEDVLAIPRTHGIYLLATQGNAPHISWSINLNRRLTRLLVPSYTEANRELVPFASKLVSVSYWSVSSRLETALILYELTREAFPDSYLRRLHLRMPWFAALTQTDSFARLEVTNRLSRKDAAAYGPFRTREAAQLYEEQTLSLFQLRRCSDRLKPSPEHPGCIYGEMNQCLRPCQTAVSSQEYASEAARVSDFLSTAGQSSLRHLLTARDRAAADLDFEQAALAHRRMEKVRAAIAERDPVVKDVDRLHGVAVTIGGGQDTVNIWPMFAGYWQTPLQIHLPAHAPQETRSLDALLRELLQQAFSAPVISGNRLEQIALFARWYHSSWCDGRWFGFESLPQLNYRGLVKAISALVKSP